MKYCKLLTTTILLGGLVFYCFFISNADYSKNSVGDEKYFRERTFLLSKILLKNSINSCNRIPNVRIETITGDSLMLSDVIQDRKKLILRISELHCGSCVDSVLRKLNGFIKNSNLKQNTIILASFDRYKDFVDFVKLNQINYPIYVLKEIPELDEIDHRPFFFTLNSDLYVHNLFLTDKSIIKLNEIYLNEISIVINKE